jgi:pyrroline-5-carboxylate reductase
MQREDFPGENGPDPMTQTHPRELPDIAFIGTGAMGSAILRGLLRAEPPAHGGIRVTGRRAEILDELAHLDDIQVFDAATDPEANIKAVRGAGIVLLAVKPHGVPKILKEITPVLAANAVVVSIAAGVTTATIQSMLPGSVSVVRAMPNTPALVGMGVTGISGGSWATKEHVELAECLFRAVGSVISVQESQIDAVTSISGSGPAYVYYFIEQLTAAAQRIGFTSEEATLMVNETFRGACELLAGSDMTPRELRQQVTSPGGTTAAAVEILESGGTQLLFERATDAALKRAIELAKDTRKDIRIGSGR